MFIKSFDTTNVTLPIFPFGLFDCEIKKISYQKKKKKKKSQIYADESYIFTSFPKYELFSTISRIHFCIGKIIFRSGSMFLKLNLSKFDLIYFSKSSRLIESLPSINI